jgi:glutathione S-transferase
MYTLYSMQRSGNCYKARLALAQLGIPYESVEIDILKGETRTPDFLAKNPNGQIPLLEVEPGHYLAESNAILWFLAERSQLLSADPVERAAILQWLFFEQHAIVPTIGAAYFWLCLVKGGRELQQHALDDWMEEGQRALKLLDSHLRDNRFMAGEHYSIADIALYAYTHLAPLCDFDLTAFVNLRDWLDRVVAQPGHVAMEVDPVLTIAAGVPEQGARLASHVD